VLGKSARKSLQHRFESEVHVGLLLIIFVLLFLTFISNLVIHKSRVRLTDQWSRGLEAASLVINRRVAEYFPGPIPDSLSRALCSRYGLTDLLLVSTRPVDDSPRAKRDWIVSVVTSIQPNEIPVLADRLFGANFGELTRGSGDSYFLIAASHTGSGYPFVVLTADLPELAYLDRSSKWIFALSVISVLFVGGLYLFLSRYIFGPFRKIRQQAARAGRPIAPQENEAEAVVAEYQRIIDDLHANQEELLRLNAAIKTKADSLEQFNEYVLKSTESGVMTLDMAGRVLAINDTATKLLDITGAAVPGRKYDDLLSGDHPLSLTLAEVISSHQLAGYREIRWSDRVVGVSMSFVRNDAGVVIGLWILLFDLSNITALRKELENQKRLSALGEMAGGLAHQLRNSMGAISGYSTLVRKHLHQSGAAEVQIESLIEETRQADQLIRRFLSFARPLECVPVVVSVGSLTKEIVDSFRVRPDFVHITLNVQAPEDGQAQLDPLLFKQVMGNLIENAALSYADRRGEVEIATTVRDKEVVITITDNGCGIPSDKLEQVFTPFYSSRPDGTGLGLPLAARIIEMHHGRLTLSSELGRGTVATIVLPAASVEPATKPLFASSVIS
jgi:signal transduction histidine kinase